MDKIDRWKLADELTVYQISLLIAGYDPSEFEKDQTHLWPDEVKKDISPFSNAIRNAARAGNMKLTEVHNENNYSDSLDWAASTINIDSLCDWMRQRNFRDGFFIGGVIEVDRFADASGNFYAPKLAAAVRAWHEVTTDSDALLRKTPKQALEIWLRKHANEYGLANKDGNPNELGIEEICKVANWKPSGGATPTSTTKPAPSDAVRLQKSTGWARKDRPGGERQNSPTRQSKLPTPRPDLDDDIPF